MLRPTLILFAALAAVLGLVAASPGATSPPQFPVTIKAANGDVVIKTRPTRVVSLSPSATEDLFAVGADAQVVAVDDQSDYPKRAPRTKLSGFTPNTEAIASYNPDLVVISNDGGLVASLEKLGITVLLEPAPDTIAQAYDEIRQIGRRNRPRRRCDTRRAGNAVEADGADPERAEEVAAPAGVPRAQPRLLLGDLVDLHRAALQALRLPQHRGRRRLVALRLPAAVGRIHRRGESRRSSCSRTRSAAGRRRDGRRTARLEQDRGGAAPPRRHGRRQPRVALGASHRRLRARSSPPSRSSP